MVEPNGRIPVHIDNLEEGNYEADAAKTGVLFIEDANAVSSLTWKGTHKPVIDLDIGHQLIPSSTLGHSHLYLDIELTHDQYDFLLQVLATLGIVERGVMYQFEKHGATFARTPWAKKKEAA